MGVNVQVNRDEQSAPSYPILMTTEEGTVVLMEEGARGTVIWCEPEAGWKVGEYYDDWAMDKFFNFRGSIVLSNA